VELPADEESLAELWGVAAPASEIDLPDPLADVNDVRRLALQVVYKLNEGIRAFLGSEYCLGQWYLTPLTQDDLSLESALKVLSDLWQSSFYPQLEELFQGRVEQLIAILGLGEDNASPGPLTVGRAFADEGGHPYIERRFTTELALIGFLRQIGGVLPSQPLAGA